MPSLTLQNPTDKQVMKVWPHALMIRASRSQAIQAFGINEKSLMIVEEKSRQIAIAKHNTDLLPFEETESSEKI